MILRKYHSVSCDEPHCLVSTRAHTKEVVRDIVKKMRNMARRKTLLVRAFIEAGLGEPPFNASQLYAYDRKLAEVCEALSKAPVLIIPDSLCNVGLVKSANWSSKGNEI